jgi:hemoglobin-like flavoprotein
MTPAQIAAVEVTVGALDLDQLAVDFYRRAFAADPDIAAMFTTDPATQRRRFASELRSIVGSIRDVEAFLPAAAQLGARHRDRGVRAAHYRVMGDALLATLAAAMGERWTTEVEEGWCVAYNLISEAMLTGTLEGRAGR